MRYRAAVIVTSLCKTKVRMPSTSIIKQTKESSLRVEQAKATEGAFEPRKKTNRMFAPTKGLRAKFVQTKTKAHLQCRKRLTRVPETYARRVGTKGRRPISML